MTGVDAELEEELRSLGVQDDDGDYDSDLTPTNSPPPSALPPASDDILTNYPSSKTSGFWEDTNYGRYSQISNYSSCSDSSLSWGEDNFEGEATRQVSLLFEQLDDLLYQDNNLKVTSYPAVPLPVGQRRRAAQQLKRKQSTLAEQILASRGLLDDTDQNGELSLLNIKKNDDGKIPPHPGDSESLHQKSLSSQQLSPQGVDNDSDDEVVWETLSTTNSEPHGTSKSTKAKLNQSKKHQSKKLSTITEQLPKHVGVNKSRSLKKKSQKQPEDIVNTDVLEDEQSLDSEDDGIEEGVEDPDDSGADRISWQDGSHDTLRTVNLAGGIYALGFAAASGQATSPLLLPTPTSPPGVPLQPTTLMKEECSYWSSRFLHLRVRGYRIDPLKLKIMESFAFGPHKKIKNHHEKPSEDLHLNVDAEGEDEGEEEVYASDGWYTPDNSDLCLVGQYLPSVAGSAGLRKPSYDKRQHPPSRSDGMDSLDNGPDEETQPSAGADRKTSNTRGGSRRVLSGSSDPEVMKEQVLVLLFDSVWPQVLNVVGGLVHRYACHLLHSAAMATSTQARPGGSASRPASGTVDYWGRPTSSRGREGGLRRPSTTNTFTFDGVDRGLHSLREERLGGLEHQEEEENSLMTPLRGAPISRLHTARALMQIQRSPLSPVWSEAGNVVSLPSLELPPQRPLSSISALSLLSSTKNSALSRNRYSSLTLELDRNNISPPTGFGSSPSPPWTKAPSTFLPPISTKGSPCLSAASSSVDVSKIISPRSQAREYRTPAGRRLARRNSDTMARVKKLQENRLKKDLPSSADYGRTSVSASSGRFPADILGVRIRDRHDTVSTVGNRRSLSDTRLSQSVTDLTSASRRTALNSHVKRSEDSSSSNMRRPHADRLSAEPHYSRRTRHPLPAPVPGHLAPGLSYNRRSSPSSRRALQRRALSVPPSTEDQVFSTRQRQQQQTLQQKGGRWATQRGAGHTDHLLEDRVADNKSKQGSGAGKGSTKSTRRRWGAPVAEVKINASSSGHSTPSPVP